MWLKMFIIGCGIICVALLLDWFIGWVSNLFEYPEDTNEE